ncbi:MAG: histidine kinase [Lachnospiraceae bacterium]|nr:histidine kinase [Lachnospiraceae bacterium]
MKRKLSAMVSGVKKIKERLLDFYQCHFLLKMTLPMGLLVIAAAVLFQGYLKTQYYEFLYQEVYHTDKVFLATQESTVSDRIYTMTRLGSVFATDAAFYREVGEAFQSGDEAVTLHVITQALNDLTAYDKSIALMAVVNEDGRVFQYSRMNMTDSVGDFWNDDNRDMLEEICGQVQKKVESKLIGDVGNCYVLSPDVTEKRGRTRYLLHMAFPIIGKQPNFSKSKGVMIVTFEMEMLDEFLSMIEGTEPDYTYGFVTDDSQEIIYHEDRTRLGMTAEEYLSGLEAESLNTVITQTGWKLYMVIDEEAMCAHVDLVYSRSIWVFLFVLILLIFFMWMIYRYMLKPLTVISGALDTVRDGELSQKIPVLGKDEICRLAMQYNQMIDSLKEQQDRTREAYQKNIESLKKANEAEREALESQINAHFLCNTLSVFNYNAIQAGNEELAVMLRSLSNILRYTFSASFQDVSVAQEIMWVEQYLYLQKYRLGDVFDYRIHFSEEYGEWPCCKLFIQPFVENSIVHGFEGRERGGLISVDCALDGDRLKCVISDNGCGIPQEKAEKLQAMLRENAALDHQGIGIGIQNVTARLRMFYGSRFGITLITRENEGTQFILYLPIPEGMSDTDDEEWL